MVQYFDYSLTESILRWIWGTINFREIWQH